MARFKDLHGQVFGKLTVVRFLGTDKNRAAVWRCRCECGGTHDVVGNVLLRGAVRSCGCLRLGLGAPNKTHGMKGTLVYGVWNTMKQRCSNPNVRGYENYGGRGIEVCRRWMKFENFYEDMGDRPEGTSLERRDNDGDYTPRNCFWATKEVQVKNKRNNRYLTANGKTLHMAEWARRLGCSPAAILARLATGMSEEEAVTKPIPARPNSKLSEDDARYIKTTYPSISMEALAAKLGVSKKTVFNVLHGKIFTDV